MGLFGKSKSEKAIEALKNGDVYVLALEIKDALEKKSGKNFGEPRMDYYEYAVGDFSAYLPDLKNPDYKYDIKIMFSEDLRALRTQRRLFVNQNSRRSNKKQGLWSMHPD